MAHRILFADLDDTIITTKTGRKFPHGIYDWKFKDGILEAIKAYDPSAIFIVTNQGGLETTMAVNMFKYKISTILIYLTNYLVRYKEMVKMPYSLTRITDYAHQPTKTTLTGNPILA